MGDNSRGEVDDVTGLVWPDRSFNFFMNRQVPRALPRVSLTSRLPLVSGSAQDRQPGRLLRADKWFNVAAILTRTRQPNLPPTLCCRFAERNWGVEWHDLQLCLNSARAILQARDR